MTQESYVQVVPDSTGKLIANVTVTRNDATGTVVYRQEIVLADPDINAFRAAITNLGALVVEPDVTRTARRLNEQVFVDHNDQLNLLAAKRAERSSYTDRRGSVGRGSTR